MEGIVEQHGKTRILGYYIPAAVSVIALVFYFSPWFGETSAISAILYGCGLLWFLGAWVPMVVQGILGIVQGFRRRASWKHHLLSVGIVALCYAGLFLGMFNGYVLTA